ncbi:MAG: tetratricopeptide repeat protein [Candidatus Hydrogenedentes bacterium]|nr:tetratricopeptide repeat protein [Candidatus Hydrogenedentota bacterium]
MTPTMLDSIEEYVQLRQRYWETKDSEEFKDDLRALKASLPKDETWGAYLEGRILFEERCFEAALAHFDRVLAIADKQRIPLELVLWSLYNKAVTLKELDRTADAQRVFAEIIEMFEDEKGSEFLYYVNRARLSCATRRIAAGEVSAGMNLCEAILHEALSSVDERQFPLAVAAAIKKLGALTDAGADKEADDFLEQVLPSIAREADRTYLSIWLRLYRARKALSGGDLESVQQDYLQIRSDFAGMCTPEHREIARLIAYGMGNAGYVMYQQGEYTDSIMACDDAFSILDIAGKTGEEPVAEPFAWHVAYVKFAALDKIGDDVEEMLALCDASLRRPRDIHFSEEEVLKQHLTWARLAIEKCDLDLALRSCEAISLMGIGENFHGPLFLTQVNSYVLLARACMHANANRIRETADVFGDLIQYLRSRHVMDWSLLRHALARKAFYLYALGERDEARAVYQELIRLWSDDEDTAQEHEEKRSLQNYFCKKYEAMARD